MAIVEVHRVETLITRIDHRGNTTQSREVRLVYLMEDPLAREARDIYATVI